MELELAPLPRTRSRPWPCAVSRAGSRLLVPPPFPSRPLKSFVRPPCLSPPAVLTTLPRARAPLLKAKEVLRAFSGLLLSSHHTLLCLPGSSVSIPAGEKYLSWLLCPFLVSPLILAIPLCPSYISFLPSAGSAFHALSYSALCASVPKLQGLIRHFYF